MKQWSDLLDPQRLPSLITLLLFQFNQCTSIHLCKPDVSGGDYMFIILFSLPTSHPATHTPSLVGSASKIHLESLSFPLFIGITWIQITFIYCWDLRKTRPDQYSMSGHITSADWSLLVHITSVLTSSTAPTA